jgi:hypothetical protein
MYSIYLLYYMRKKYIINRAGKILEKSISEVRLIELSVSV